MKKRPERLGPFALGTLAELCGGSVTGDASLLITAVRSLAAAQPSDLTFIADQKAAKNAASSRAGAFLVKTGSTISDRPVIEVADPSLALIPILLAFHPRRKSNGKIHPTAVIAESAVLGENVEAGPFVVVGERTEIGAGSILEPHSVVGADCVLAQGVWLHPHVVLYDGVSVGPFSEIHSGAVIGADGFGYTTSKTGIRKIPQVGHVEIGADVEIGANSCVDRASLEVTRVGGNTKIDDLVMVGHNCELGRSNFLCGQVGLAGSSITGDGVVLAGQVGVGGHVRIGNGVKAGAQAGIKNDVPDGQEIWGSPAIPFRECLRVITETQRLPETGRLVRKIAKQLELGDKE